MVPNPIKSNNSYHPHSITPNLVTFIGILLKYHTIQFMPHQKDIRHLIHWILMGQELQNIIVHWLRLTDWDTGHCVVVAEYVSIIGIHVNAIELLIPVGGQSLFLFPFTKLMVNYWNCNVKELLVMEITIITNDTNSHCYQKHIHKSIIIS